MAIAQGPLSVELTGFGGQIELHLIGELDIASAPLLLEYLQEAYESGVPELTLDATALEFVDSVGLSLLVGAHKRSASEGNVLLLRGVGPQLSRLLSINGLSSYFDEVDDPRAPS